MDEIDRKRKRFFALGRELNIDSEELKERAKKHFGEKETFNNLTLAQLKILIAKLEAQLESKRH